MEVFLTHLATVVTPTALTALGLALLGAAPWVPLATPVRMLLLVLGVAFCIAAQVLAIVSASRRAGLVRRWLNHLERIGRDGLSPDETPELPSYLAGHPWRSLLQRIQRTVLDQQERSRTAELARAALEVRVRRQQAQQKRVSSVLATLSDPVVAIDALNQVVLANSSAEQLFGLTAGGTEERVAHELLRCEQLVELLQDTGRRAGSGRRSLELDICDAQGQPRPYRVTATSIAAPATGDRRSAPPGEPQGAVAVLHDLTAEREAQRRHAEFVSAVSHEMKTPLASIKAYVELLVDGDAEDEATQEEFLDVINSQADRLQRLIDNLLNLARIEAGVTRVDKQERSLNELLEEAARVIQPAAERRGQQFSVELSPLYLGVYADRDTLLQAAINLLSNAVKYTPEGGALTLRSRLDGDEASFEVSDTGVGLSAEDCQKVFEKFYRVKKDSQMASGTGLGLPLVKHIVEDIHGGRIVLESQPGQGSTFRVVLPVAGQLVER